MVGKFSSLPLKSFLRSQLPSCLPERQQASTQPAPTRRIRPQQAISPWKSAGVIPIWVLLWDNRNCQPAFHRLLPGARPSGCLPGKPTGIKKLTNQTMDCTAFSSLTSWNTSRLKFLHCMMGKLDPLHLCTHCFLSDGPEAPDLQKPGCRPRHHDQDTGLYPRVISDPLRTVGNLRCHSSRSIPTTDTFRVAVVRNHHARRNLLPLYHLHTVDIHRRQGNLLVWHSHISNKNL